MVRPLKAKAIEKFFIGGAFGDIKNRFDVAHLMRNFDLENLIPTGTTEIYSNWIESLHYVDLDSTVDEMLGEEGDYISQQTLTERNQTETEQLVPTLHIESKSRQWKIMLAEDNLVNQLVMKKMVRPCVNSRSYLD